MGKQFPLPRDPRDGSCLLSPSLFRVPLIPQSCHSVLNCREHVTREEQLAAIDESGSLFDEVGLLENEPATPSFCFMRSLWDFFPASARHGPCQFSREHLPPHWWQESGFARLRPP